MRQGALLGQTEFDVKRRPPMAGGSQIVETDPLALTRV
jgi:hypothetical protein